MPALTICLGLMCLQAGLSETAQRILCFMHITHARWWTRQLCERIDRKLRAQAADPARYNQTIKLACADNKGYMMRKKFQNEDSNGEFVQTTNWFWAPLPLPQVRARHRAAHMHACAIDRHMSRRCVDLLASPIVHLRMLCSLQRTW